MPRFTAFRLLLVFGGAALLTSPPPARAQVPVVTGLSPARNARTAARTTNVVVTYSQALNAATAGNLRVFSAQAGGRKAGLASSSSATLTFNATTDFRPGERVMVSAPATIQSSTGVAVVRHAYEFRTAAGVGPGTFATGTTSILAAAGPMALGDVDGDGDQDLLTAQFDALTNNVVSIRLNNGTGLFSVPTSVTVGRSTRALALGDLDGDGDLDLLATGMPTGAVSSSTQTVQVRFNNGTGTFSGTSEVSVGTLAAGSTINDLALADVDADGDLDLIAANSAGTVTVRFNGGTGTFFNSVDLPATTRCDVLAVGDVNGDGSFDILVADTNANTYTQLLNNGAGAFSGGSTFLFFSVTGVRTLALADANGDGTLDLFIISNSSLRVVANTGNGTFSNVSNLACPVVALASQLAVADVDGDGDLDAIVGGPGVTSVRLNTGTGTFSGASDIPGGTIGGGAADLDGDGDLDFVAGTPGTSGGSGVLTTRLNQVAPVISSFTPVTTGAGVGATVEISGTGFVSQVTGATQVKFNGVSAAAIATNTTSVTATVPAGATTGPITVTTPSGAAVSSASFTVIPAPTITNFTPTTGPPGTVVTISGANLTNTSSVRFNGAAVLSFGTISPTSATVIVPALASTGVITLTTLGGTATSAASFTFLTPVTLAVDSVTAVQDVETLVPVRVRDFANVVAMQGTLSFNQNAPQSTFVAVEQFSASVPGLAAANFVVSAGAVSFVWASAGNTPLTLPANTVLFVLRVLPARLPFIGSQHRIQWATGPVPVEVVQAPATVAPVSLFGARLLFAPVVGVSGVVRTGAGLTVPGVTVSFSLTSARAPNILTSVSSASSSLFFFNGFATGAYTLTPTKTNDVTVTNGVTVSDIVLLQRHILGTQLLNSAPRFLAGDVNRDAVLTVADVALVQEFILGRTTAFPGGLLWRFYPTGLGLTANSPGNPAPSRTYASLAAAALQDFTACKFGDVNDTWNPAIARAATGGPAVALAFGVPAAPVAPGARVQVPLTLVAAARLAGLQGTLAWDSAALRLVGATPALANLRTGTPVAGQLTFVWTEAATPAPTLPAGAPLLWLDFEVTGAPGTAAALDLLAAPTPALALDAALDAHPLSTAPAALLVGGPLNDGAAAAADASALRVWPNPAHDAARLTGAPPSAPVLLLDALGRVALMVPAGANGAATLELRTLPAGIYLLRAGTATRRLVVE